MSNEWVKVVSKRSKNKNNEPQNKPPVYKIKQEERPMPSMYIWHLNIRSYCPAHIATIAFNTEQAIEYILTNLKKYKQIKENLDKSAGKYGVHWKTLEDELKKNDVYCPIINWEGPFTGNLYDLLDQYQIICENSNEKIAGQHKCVSLEKYLSTIQPEIRPIKLGMIIGSTSLDG